MITEFPVFDIYSFSLQIVLQFINHTNLEEFNGCCVVAIFSIFTDYLEPPGPYSVDNGSTIGSVFNIPDLQDGAIISVPVEKIKDCMNFQ